MNARRILANTAFRTIADLGSKVASVVLYAVMARRLGDEGFGVFAFGLAFVTIVTTFASFGYKTVLTREVARDHERVHEFFANTLALQVGLSLPVLGLALAAGPLLGFDGDMHATVALLGVAVVAEAVMATVFAVYQAWERLVFIPIVLISQRWLTAAAGVAALLAGASVVAVAAIYLAGALLALALAAVLMARHVVRPSLRIDLARWRPLFIAALPIGLAGVFATVIYRADTALLAAFETDAIVGQYGAAYRLLESTLFISWAVGAAVYPVFSRRGAGGEEGLAPVAEGAFKLVLALAAPLAVGAALVAGPAMRAIYGGGFGEGAEALVILAIAIVAHPIGYVAEYLLLSQDRQRTVLLLYAVLAAATVGLSVVLIPALSLHGAALVTASAEVVAALAAFAIGSRLAGGLSLLRIAGGPLVASAACAAAILPVRGSLAASIALGGAAYLLVLWAWERRLFPADVAVVAGFLRRRVRKPAAGPVT